MSLRIIVFRNGFYWPGQVRIYELPRPVFFIPAYAMSRTARIVFLSLYKIPDN